jgi:ADP-ribose pyrophosphatase
MMANFFFYGTLCHLPLLEKVLGYRPALFVAELPDYEVYWALDESYPVIGQTS